MRFIYNLFFGIGFIFFVPGLLYKLKHRPGYKKTYAERFGFFTTERKNELKNFHGAIWLHAVSVGETVVALSFLKSYLAKHPEQKFILSTTTTTGQELARRQSPENVAVIFCPIDFYFAVKNVYKLLNPSMLLILETELWPNLIHQAAARKIPIGIINGRMSDKSSRGYRRLRWFFGRMLSEITFIAAQSEMDAQRYNQISYTHNAVNCGNMKFDQQLPEQIPDAALKCYFGENFGKVILGASTHPGEEALIINTFIQLKKTFSDLKLILIPRHAERGSEIAALLENAKLTYIRKSINTSCDIPVDVLLADTTGEMIKFMNCADIVIMGKSLAGQDEGHNLIEPSLLKKPIVCGNKLKNFRYLFDLLKNADALTAVADDGELKTVLEQLLNNPEKAMAMGERAFETVRKNAGAIDKTVSLVFKNMVIK